MWTFENHYVKQGNSSMSLLMLYQKYRMLMMRVVVLMQKIKNVSSKEFWITGRGFDCETSQKKLVMVDLDVLSI